MKSLLLSIFLWGIAISAYTQKSNDELKNEIYLQKHKVVVNTAMPVIEGVLKQQAGQKIKLMGFNYFDTDKLGEAKIDDTGYFVLRYDPTYRGMAYLQTEDKAAYYVVLGKDTTIQIISTRLDDVDSLDVAEGVENQLFVGYTKSYSTKINRLTGWRYLYPLYANTKDSAVAKMIKKEIANIVEADKQFLDSLLDDNSYLKWYIPLRKLVSDMRSAPMHYPDSIPSLIDKFRHIDFTNPNFRTSGIYGMVLDWHYWMIENDGTSLDSVYKQMNISTDYLLSNIESNDKLLNMTINHLFDLLERRSLFKASEHLALKSLKKYENILDRNLKFQLETYRSMKVGNIAPDITFRGTKIQDGKELSKTIKLSKLNNKYTLVVFGASWCPECVKNIPKIKKYYQKWKNKGLDIVFVSLDTDKDEFKKFVKDFPWLSSCDCKGWDTKAALDYYVSSSPTIFLLDKNRKILVRPISIEQVDAWVKYKLK